MLTLADVEAKHNALKREMRRIRVAMSQDPDNEELPLRLDELVEEARIIFKALKHYRETTEFLLKVEPYGGAQ